MFGAQERHVAVNRRIVPMLAQKIARMRAGIGKEHLLDECEGRRRTLDVQQNDSDIVERIPQAKAWAQPTLSIRTVPAEHTR